MRLRSALAIGMTAATLAPAALAGTAAVADEKGLVDTQLCALTGLVGAGPDAGCAADARQVGAADPGRGGLAEAPEQRADGPRPQGAAAPGSVPEQPPARQQLAAPDEESAPDLSRAHPSTRTPARTADQVLAAAPARVEVAPAVLPARPGGAARPGAARGPECGVPADPDFPIDTRIHGGPADYVPGGGFRAWSLELTNTTAEACRAIHPVVVLVDRDRDLRASAIRMEFRDTGGVWHPVPFTRTDEDENIGVFDDGFPGFVVGPGRTVTVPVRLAFAPATGDNEVVANAAVVQRKGDDGDWVGESNDYRFTLAEDGAAPAALAGELAETGPGSLLGLGAAAGAFLLGGGALVVGSRRLPLRGR
ncbi:hypothetical protein ABT160_03100 [Streptomyces sp. NPDC001941]|uniref:hypothetical protein n=1 Tax=Streptomyces sp. NPDC001941 TaxID=3154659 RepID=UPI00332EF4FE